MFMVEFFFNCWGSIMRAAGWSLTDNLSLNRINNRAEKHQDALLIAVWQMTLNASLDSVLHLWANKSLLILCYLYLQCAVKVLKCESLLTEGGFYRPEPQSHSVSTVTTLKFWIILCLWSINTFKCADVSSREISKHFSSDKLWTDTSQQSPVQTF